MGRDVYNYRCYFCHGYNGDARTLAATMLSPPPASFKDKDPISLPLKRIIETVRHGRQGTAMQSFQRQLPANEIDAVARFVFDYFVVNKKYNTRYHTEENGWSNHEKYRDAFPFALGELAIDTPMEQLSESQRRGLVLFFESCVSCHDQGNSINQKLDFNKRAISFPRNGFDFRTDMDSVSAASVYARHDLSVEENLSTTLLQGKKLFEDNCAFCHGKDGKGKNWIGSFLDSPPQDLTDENFLKQNNKKLLVQKIANGVQGTAMSAWKNVLTETQINSIVDYLYR